MKNFKPVFVAAALSLTALSFGAHAQTATTAKDIDANYKAEQKKCDAMKGNDKDVCEQQAKATRDKAKADLKENKDQAEARRDADKTKNKADYKVAKEKCDALSGDAKDTCVANAKKQYHQ
ncbi:hypothetical protein CAL29_29335 [Bordetella genomosp. 10]|uniref:Cell envelope biogenesis protein TolA n=1 Tax=Bordetella genomosp. 10 TaxID=1416804 RepID=A0A261S3P2_9BORD|nr:hypothetical protein [Bordetella genomosp. 10]OZI31956.1 hypothetical protein CAL29_29335 [Bordetella genomosp. 10]